MRTSRSVTNTGIAYPSLTELDNSVPLQGACDGTTSDTGGQNAPPRVVHEQGGTDNTRILCSHPTVRVSWLQEERAFRSDNPTSGQLAGRDSLSGLPSGAR